MRCLSLSGCQGKYSGNPRGVGSTHCPELVAEEQKPARIWAPRTGRGRENSSEKSNTPKLRLSLPGSRIPRREPLGQGHVECPSLASLQESLHPAGSIPQNPSLRIHPPESIPRIHPSGPIPQDPSLRIHHSSGSIPQDPSPGPSPQDPSLRIHARIHPSGSIPRIHP